MTDTKGGRHKDNTQTRYLGCTGKSHNRICTGKSHNRICTDTKATLYAASLEDMVYALIFEKLSTLKTSKRKMSTDNSNAINLLKNRISEIKLSQERLVNLLFNDELQNDMISLLNEKAKKLSEERQSINEKIENLESEKTDIIKVIDISKKWETAKFDERKARRTL